MNILITNDDGYRAKGLGTLVRIMRQFGDVIAVAPKYYQSGMATAVSMGLRRIAVRKVSGGGEVGGVPLWYVDGTPATCVKFALDNICPEIGFTPDVVVSGINHGSNAATAMNYSGTLGAAEEAAINGLPAIGVSLDAFGPEESFSAVESLFPDIFGRLMPSYPRGRGVYYNVNFPSLPPEEIRGVRVAHQGLGHWVKEFTDWNVRKYERYGLDASIFGTPYAPQAEEGEELYMMAGTFIDDSGDDGQADHHVMAEGYVAVCAHKVDTTDYEEIERLSSLGFNRDFTEP